MNIDKLTTLTNALVLKYELIGINIDTECIYDLGDLSGMLREITSITMADKNIDVTERISEDGTQYVATLSNGAATIEMFADTDTDWLPDSFFDLFESIPVVFGSTGRFIMLNPAIDPSQCIYYFFGTEETLRLAREEGLPVVFPGENPEETEAYRNFRD
ncbi:MAG: hypothetical protein ABI876_02560 [Bacteroidota bacterium]